MLIADEPSVARATEEMMIAAMKMTDGNGLKVRVRINHSEAFRGMLELIGRLTWGETPVCDPTELIVDPNTIDLTGFLRAASGE